MSGDSLTLLVMSDTKLFNILKITCEVIGDQHKSRKFNSQTIEASNGPSCKINKAPQINPDKANANDTNASMPHYFSSGINRAVDKRVSQALTNKIHHVFSDFFSVIGCFEGTFTLQVKDARQPYQELPPKDHLCTPGIPEKEARKIQKQQIIVPLGIDETSEWCNSFILVPKVNCKVRLCLDQVRNNKSKAPIRPVHRGPTFNDVLPRLASIKYLTLINSTSGYHNLKLDERPSYLGRFSCPLGRYIYIRIPFRAVPVGDMFQKKIDELYAKCIWHC